MCSIPGDEVLAYGAAIEAGHLMANYRGNTNGTSEAPVTNGTAVNGNEKDKKKKIVEKRKEVIKSHLPVMISAVSVNIWAKVRCFTILSRVYLNFMIK